MKRYAFYTVMLLLLASCSGSKVTNAWKAKDATSGAYNKIMVVGIIKDSDHALQYKLEHHMVGDLAALGYGAVSAFELYGPKYFEGLKEEEAINKIKSTGVDAVITIVLLDKSKELSYVPGRTVYAHYYGKFWGYYNTMYGRIYEPGYYQENTKYFFESNLYDMNDNKLVYSIQTQSFAPSSTEALGHEYGKLIVKAMVKDAVLHERLKPFSLR